MTLRGLNIFRQGVQWFVVYSFLKPLGWLSFRVFRFLLLPMYSRYTKIKNRLRSHPSFRELESFNHFLQRYALHVALILLGVFGVSHNILARTIRPDEVGIGTLWAAYQPESSFDVITETVATKLAVADTPAAIAVGGPTLTATESTSTDLNDESTPIGPPLTAVGEAAGGIDSIGDERSEVVGYEVQAGDTISTIAVSFGLSSRTILWANGLGERDFIKPGQVLKIPPVNGVLYTVKAGDTLAGIANKYKGDQDSILQENHLASADAIQVNQQIIIPGGELPAPPPPAQIAQVPNRRNIFEKIFVAPPSARASKDRFIWPTVLHRVNQYFRGRYHTGVDIDCNYGMAEYAAAAGTVTFAGSDRSGYGLHVIINHGNGYTTLYGHASTIFVKSGQRVNQGQTIAMCGSTGRSTGTHLHFEVRSGGGYVNPLAYF